MSHDALKEDDVTDIEGRLIEKTNDIIRLAIKVPEGAETGPRTLLIKDSAGNVIARRSNMVRIVSAAKPRPTTEEGGRPAKPAPRVGAKLAAKTGAVDTSPAKPAKGGPRRATKGAARKRKEDKKS